jgi:aminomethyltransferase
LVLSTPLDDLKTNQLLHVNDLIVSRTGYTGEDGVEIVAPVNQYLALWDLLIKQGAGPCGLGARDTLRLEAGLPLYGHEYDETKTPLEVGYSWAVKFDKGDFVGRPSLLKEKEQGLRKRLVGITLTGRAIPRQGTLVLDNLTQTQIGQVTSGTFSPTFKQPIALAFLTGGARSLGDKVLLEIRSEKLIGTIVDKVFYKRVK